MIDSASGVFDAHANIAAMPTPAPSSSGMPRPRASTLPSVAPMKNRGVTSPPRKPEPIVIAVSSELDRERPRRQRRIGERALDRSARRGRGSRRSSRAAAMRRRRSRRRREPQRRDLLGSSARPRVLDRVRRSTNAVAVELRSHAANSDPLAAQQRIEIDRALRSGTPRARCRARARREIADDRRDQRGRERVVLEPPSTMTSSPKTAPATGVPKTEPKPPATPAASSCRRTRRHAQPMRREAHRASDAHDRRAPRPALPPKRWVSTAPTRTGAMRSGARAPPSCSVSMMRFVPRAIGLRAIVDPADHHARPRGAPAACTVGQRCGRPDRDADHRRTAPTLHPHSALDRDTGALQPTPTFGISLPAGANFGGACGYDPALTTSGVVFAALDPTAVIAARLPPARHRHVPVTRRYKS